MRGQVSGNQKLRVWLQELGEMSGVQREYIYIYMVKALGFRDYPKAPKAIWGFLRESLGFGS